MQPLRVLTHFWSQQYSRSKFRSNDDGAAFVTHHANGNARSMQLLTITVMSRIHTPMHLKVR